MSSRNARGKIFKIGVENRFMLFNTFDIFHKERKKCRCTFVENRIVFRFSTRRFREKILFPKFWKARGRMAGKEENRRIRRSDGLSKGRFSTSLRRGGRAFSRRERRRYLIYARASSPYIYIVGFAERNDLRRGGCRKPAIAGVCSFSALSLLNKEKTLYFFLLRGILIRLFIEGLWFLTVKGSRYEAHLSAE